MEKAVKLLSRGLCAAITAAALVVGYFYIVLPCRISVDGAAEPTGGFAQAVHGPAQNAGDQHIRQGVAQRQINAHQVAVGGKAHQPHQQVPAVYSIGKMILLQHKEVYDLNGDHGGKH